MDKSLLTSKDCSKVSLLTLVSALFLNLYSRNLLVDVDILTHLLEISKSVLGFKKFIFVAD